MKTEDALIQEFGTKIIPLESVIHYAGISAAKWARDKAAIGRLPFPAFKVGSAKGKWYVNAEHLAAYLDNLSKEATNLHAKINT